ncbi:MAG: pentapeptide repeat-containing protein, partial [Leptolyngbyaceae cyanobacterium CAN_BIN12]|nr:pentapeptide repeat-containing protein [Leptolyngbyaceae cyanobacterium CAN_BIN12]
MDTRSPRSIDLSIFSRLIALLLFIGLLLPFSNFQFLCPAAQAAIAQPDRVPLTLEILQDRLKNLVQSDGLPTVDLHGLIIDLSSENTDFRDQFYQLVKVQIQRPGTPVGLDLSNSVIQGDFQVSQLGLRAPLYG